jgi:hypothetical protein
MEIKKYFDKVPDHEMDVNLVDLMLRRLALGYEQYGPLQEYTKERPIDLATDRIKSFKTSGEERFLLDAVTYLMYEIMYCRKERYTSKNYDLKEYGKGYYIDGNWTVEERPYEGATPWD